MTYTDTLTSIHENSDNEWDNKAYSSIAKRCFALIATKDSNGIYPIYLSNTIKEFPITCKTNQSKKKLLGFHDIWLPLLRKKYLQAHIYLDSIHNVVLGFGAIQH